MGRSTQIAWIIAASSFLLLTLSLTGSGTGPFGMGVFSHMLWSYLLLIAGAGLALRLATRPARTRRPR